MIEFEVTESPDQNVKSVFKFYKNEIFLGTKSPDLTIIDPELKPLHLLIEIPETDLLVHPQKDVAYYLINGKRSTTIRKIKNGDLITLGKTVVKIVRFEPTIRKSKKEILNEKMSQLLEEDSPKLPIIEKLTKLMK
jgi:hypothetical protein